MRRKKPMLVRDWATECNLDRNRDLWRVEEGGVHPPGPRGATPTRLTLIGELCFKDPPIVSIPRFDSLTGEKKGRGRGCRPLLGPKCNKKACLTVVQQPADSHRSGRYRGSEDLLGSFIHWGLWRGTFLPCTVAMRDKRPPGTSPCGSENRAGSRKAREARCR
ncbi:hypothetical protein CABS01_09882 [Colletotrichum abscissum]|uniref:uncharacterized protein n=1 Tax=Colletotrichum abscissum TaxID=1671311 RepID=UPI0027D7100D|nr:uncharacterized protein CABS01_09882 [Colletotrichum abscissum]KAK1501147.1 hypothetical protein CABS01_09882 [Colletotrichum abscissum]